MEIQHAPQKKNRMEHHAPAEQCQIPKKGNYLSFREKKCKRRVVENKSSQTYESIKKQGRK